MRRWPPEPAQDLLKKYCEPPRDDPDRLPDNTQRHRRNHDDHNQQPAMEADLPRGRHPRAGLAPCGAPTGPGCGRVPQRCRRRVRTARPLPAQGRATVARHRVWHAGSLPAAQLDHRPVRRAGIGSRRRLHAQVRREGGRWRGVSGCPGAGRACGRFDAPRSRAGAARPGGLITPQRPSNTKAIKYIAISAFPSSARAQKTSGIHAMQETKSTCPYCGVGCGVIIESEGAQITGVRGEPPQPLPWDAALNLATEKFANTIQNHGPDAVGFYVSGQLLTEDYYVFNKLAKGLIGTNNIDTNSRLCMSSAVAGYKQTLGADAPPACYDDVKHAQCLFIVGSNAAGAHPILFRRIEDARASNPGMKVIVADPRRTDTAGMADLFLPIQPGSDVMLFNGMLHIMLWEGWVDTAYIAAHSTGFDELKALVRDYTPERVAQTCGISVADLTTAAKWFAQSKATLSLYCQGLNQSSSGTAKNAALINLHLATAQIGKPGAGPFSLTGQPNAMGGREVGGLANLLSAHRDLANPQHRAEVAALWGVADVPSKPGKTAVEMFQAAADGEIRALWIACTSPAQSMPDQATVRRALQRAEFVVVQEAFATAATCAYADLLLPATT